MGSLAGSSGVAYQTTHRSPLSYNMDITKSSPMTGLAFGKFGRNPQQDGNADVQEVMENHNAIAGSFYKESVSMSGTESAQQASLYDDLIERLSHLMESGGGTGEDMSDIHGDTLSQVYYYGITAIMLYLLYKMLYRNNRR